MARSCFFCQTGRPLTREHVWAEWLVSIFPEGADLYEAELIQKGVGAAPEKSWSRRKPEFEVRTVCRPCNTGWMSDLESQSAPILSPLIRGETTRISQVDQLTIGTWAAKTAFVIESMYPSVVVSTQEERDIIRSQGRPPATVQIRLAAYGGDRYAFISTRLVATTRQDHAPDSSATTMLIGRLAIQVFRPSLETEYRSFERVGIPDDAYIPILPISVEGITWPPRVPLDDDTFSDFARSTFPDFPSLPDVPA